MESGVAVQVAFLPEDVETKVRAGYRPGSNACMERCPLPSLPMRRKSRQTYDSNLQ